LFVVYEQNRGGVGHVGEPAERSTVLLYPGMAAVPPSATRRRPRPGSLDRPVNGRLYRGTWLLVGLPLLVLAFSVARPRPLPGPDVAPAFDAGDAVAVSQDLTGKWPDRAPGTQGAR